MKKALYYLSYLMFPLGFFNIKYGKFYDFDLSISFILICIGCVLQIPKLCVDLKETSNIDSMLRCRHTIIMMGLGAIFCFALSIAFLPHFGL